MQNTCLLKLFELGVFSFQAGCGISAKTAAGLLFEWRGHSWSVGGDKSIDEGVYTIPSKR